ncbi:MAG: JAB domain-containing protein [Candidatus Edwardsbacteria bacterium]
MEIKLKEKIVLTTPQEVANTFYQVLKNDNPIDQDKEHFWAVGLNTRNKIKYTELVSLGTLNSSLVHPREIFRLAIFKGVAQLIVIHNHPSGSLEPSEDDLEITKKLVQAGKLLGIELIDHLIIGKNLKHGFLSFKEENIL